MSQSSVLSYAESRGIYGREMLHKPSRFIREIPIECLEEIRLRTQVSRPTQYGRFSQNEVQQSFDPAASSSALYINYHYGHNTICYYKKSGTPTFLGKP